MMATISRLQVYCYGFFLHPPKSQPFHRCRKKKESDIFLILFSPLAGIRFGWRPVSHYCRPLFFRRCFLIVACDVAQPDESEWVPLPGLGLAEKTVSRLLIVTNISSSGC
jgi:hypothetical protein